MPPTRSRWVLVTLAGSLLLTAPLSGRAVPLDPPAASQASIPLIELPDSAPAEVPPPHPDHGAGGPPFETPVGPPEETPPFPTPISDPPDGAPPFALPPHDGPIFSMPDVLSGSKPDWVPPVEISVDLDVRKLEMHHPQASRLELDDPFWTRIIEPGSQVPGTTPPDSTPGPQVPLNVASVEMIGVSTPSPDLSQPATTAFAAIPEPGSAGLLALGLLALRLLRR